MTDSQLQVLHQRGEAILGRTYISSTGKRYIGIEKGRLRLIQGVNTSVLDALQAQIDSLQAQIDALSGGSGGGEDLDQTLTIGNDAGGQDIENLAGIQDSTPVRSIDVEHRQLVNDTGAIWTIDWQNLQLSDLSGQLGIDWGTRELVNNTLIPTFDWQNIQFPTLTGAGTEMATLGATGLLGRAPIPAGTVTSVGATAPITTSGGVTPTISTSMSTNKLIGRYNSGTGVMEEVSLGTNTSITGGTLNSTINYPEVLFNQIFS